MPVSPLNGALPTTLLPPVSIVYINYCGFIEFASIPSNDAFYGERRIESFKGTTINIIGHYIVSSFIIFSTLHPTSCPCTCVCGYFYIYIYIFFFYSVKKATGYANLYFALIPPASLSWFLIQRKKIYIRTRESPNFPDSQFPIV